MFGAVEESALDVLHVLGDAGGDLAGLALIVVADGELKEAAVEIGAEINENLLLERIVDADTRAVESVAQKITPREGDDAPDEEVAAAGGNDVIDDPLNDLGDGDEEECAADGEGEG